MLAVIAAFDPIPEAEKALVAMADVPDEDPKKLYVASQIVQHEVKVANFVNIHAAAEYRKYQECFYRRDKMHTMCLKEYTTLSSVLSAAVEEEYAAYGIAAANKLETGVAPSAE